MYPYRLRRYVPGKPKFSDPQDLGYSYDVHEVYTRDFDLVALSVPATWDGPAWLAFSDTEDYPLSLTPSTLRLMLSVISFVPVEVLREIIKRCEGHVATRRTCTTVLAIRESPVTAETVRRALMRL